MKRENKGQRVKARRNGEWRIVNGEMAEPRHPFSLWACSPLAGEGGGEGDIKMHFETDLKVDGAE
jgi:hypothetical protein